LRNDRMTDARPVAGSVRRTANGQFGRLLVLLPVRFGLLGMHALVVSTAARRRRPPVAGIGATGHEMSRTRPAGGGQPGLNVRSFSAAGDAVSPARRGREWVLAVVGTPP